MDNSENIEYTIKIDSHRIIENYTEYLVIIKSNKSIFDNEIQIYERYSNLSNLNDKLKKETKNKNFPKFPPKKFFGSKEEKFLIQRQKDLNNYFEVINHNEEFKKLPSLLDWIKISIKKYKEEILKEDPNSLNPYGENAEKRIKEIAERYKQQYFDMNGLYSDQEDMTEENLVGNAIEKMNIFSNDNIDKVELNIPKGNDINFQKLSKDNCDNNSILNNAEAHLKRIIENCNNNIDIIMNKIYSSNDLIIYIKS